jgi:ubiquinone/menaquinone biosynthesis C-methylase UbiE
MKVRDSGMPEETLWSTFFDVENILSRLEVNASIQDLMEVGCGYGTFTLDAAKKISGTVHAFDIDPEMISCTSHKAVLNRISNINYHNRDIISQGTGLTSGSMDYAMLFNILHHDNPNELFSEVWRVLKPGGRTGIIHWRSDIETPRGPELSIRPTPEQCVEWAIQSGFMMVKEPEVLKPYHFGLVIQKPLAGKIKGLLS